jgi:hypothetical protein
MKFLIVILVAFGIIFCCTQILRNKPLWLVKLYVDIWRRPYPTKRRIDSIGVMLVVIAYLAVMAYIVFFDR